MNTIELNRSLLAAAKSLLDERVTHACAIQLAPGIQALDPANPDTAALLQLAMEQPYARLGPEDVALPDTLDATFVCPECEHIYQVSAFVNAQCPRCKTPSLTRLATKATYRRGPAMHEFPMGRLVATPVAAQILEDASLFDRASVYRVFLRHKTLNDDNPYPSDRQANQRSLCLRAELLTVHMLIAGGKERKLYVITAADRAHTCVCLPEER